MRSMLLQVVALIGLVVLGPLASAQSDGGRWFSIEMAGQRAGWMKSTSAAEGDLITSTEEMNLTIARGPIEISIAALTEFVEREDGTPVSIRTVQEFGGKPQELVVRFLGNGKMSVRRGAAAAEQMLDAPPAGWVTPSQTRQRLAEAIEEGRSELTLNSFDPLVSLAPAVVEYSGFEPTEIELWGRTVEVYRVKSSTAAMMGLTTTEYVTRTGEPLKVSTSIGGIEMTMTAATREIARGMIDPPEMMVSTFVAPDRPIKDARRTRRAAFEVSVDGAAFDAMPSVGGQRVTELGGTTYRVEVDTDETQPAEADDLATAMKPSAAINHEAGIMRELVIKARPDADANAGTRAEAIRRFVHNYIDAKSLGVAFGTASDVAVSREGDCTEHAVLLAALLRADGIPARVVSGLVYADYFAGHRDVFAYHMWTQAALPTGTDGNLAWTDLDATLGPNTAFDATHIALGVSTLPDDAPLEGLVDIIPALGRLSIKVESIE